MLRRYHLASPRMTYIAPKGDIRGRMDTEQWRVIQWRHTWLGLAIALAAGMRGVTK